MKYTPFSTACRVVAPHGLVMFERVVHEIEVRGEEHLGAFDRENPGRPDVTAISADHHAELQAVLFKDGKLAPRQAGIPSYRLSSMKSPAAMATRSRSVPSLVSLDRIFPVIDETSR